MLGKVKEGMGVGLVFAALCFAPQDDAPLWPYCLLVLAMLGFAAWLLKDQFN